MIYKIHGRGLEISTAENWKEAKRVIEQILPRDNQIHVYIFDDETTPVTIRPPSVKFEKGQHIVAYGHNPLDLTYYEYSSQHPVYEHALIREILDTDNEAHLYVNKRKSGADLDNPWF